MVSHDAVKHRIVAADGEIDGAHVMQHPAAFLSRIAEENGVFKLAEFGAVCEQDLGGQVFVYRKGEAAGHDAVFRGALLAACQRKAAEAAVVVAVK